MRQLKVLTRIDIVTPKDLCRLNIHLGLETPSGERYVRNVWASSQDDFKFWYPFVGGPKSTVYTCIMNEGDILRLIDKGCKFYDFETVKEMYQWMAAGKGY